MIKDELPSDSKRERLRAVAAFVLALPRLPGAVWVQRREIVNTLFGRHVWLGAEGRRAYEQHLADHQRWRRQHQGNQP